MYENVIDKKGFITKDNERIVDLTTSIFKQLKSTDILYNIYRVPESMVMRPDLLSLAEYDSDEYTDIILKYNNISNPFSLNKDDIIFLPTINTIDNDIEDANSKSNSEMSDYERIKNYHKYIDKSKAPETVGSEKNDKVITKTPSSNYEEANLSQTDQMWVSATPDRIYFNGSVPSTEKDYNKNGNGTAITLRNGRMLFDEPNSPECGIYGMTSSNFMISKIENELE